MNPDVMTINEIVSEYNVDRVVAIAITKAFNLAVVSKRKSAKGVGRPSDEFSRVDVARAIESVRAF